MGKSEMVGKETIFIKAKNMLIMIIIQTLVKIAAAVAGAFGITVILCCMVVYYEGRNERKKIKKYGEKWTLNYKGEVVPMKKEDAVTEFDY